MTLLLGALFIIVPLLELYVIIQVGAAIGALNTIALLIVVSVGGAWLMKREGWAVYARMRRSLEEGRMIGRELVDAVLILFGGALMLTPGFITDVFGLALLLPPVRAVLRPWLVRRLTERAARRTFRGPGGPSGYSGYIDV